MRYNRPPGMLCQRVNAKDYNEVIELRNYKYHFRGKQEAIY